ncbi:hypothetical protein [Alienimonas chondri]|uniref:Uncharacterized protein n=1 Tax=Alienimonas chondri TaxID=2681879 RepID=A0ABX1VBX9_9PLAN|nr:hypothetical protein [Alienimonas chondri]NNJ24936.1 hypothetical protein [Alienimonas chondri]
MNDFDASSRATRSISSVEERSGSLTREDREHLRILSILHYVSAGMTALGICAGGAWVAAVLTFAGAGAGEQGVFWLVAVVGAVAVLLNLAIVIAQTLAGRNLHRLRGRTFCLVVAAIECLNVPFGTLVGVFTIVVLSRPTVRAAFEANEPKPDDPYSPRAQR